MGFNPDRAATSQRLTVYLFAAAKQAPLKGPLDILDFPCEKRQGDQIATLKHVSWSVELFDVGLQIQHPSEWRKPSAQDLIP